MSRPDQISFADNPALKGREKNFITVNIAMKALLWDWKDSLFAHEWLTRDGSLKSDDYLSIANKERKQMVLTKLDQGDDLPRPVLGIGIMDNIEIGSGKDVVMALAERGCLTFSAHIPKSDADMFKDILG